MNLVIRDRKKMARLLNLVIMFIIISAVSFGNTQGGGTGIFDGLFDFLKKLIVDFRYLLILVGAIGIVVSQLRSEERRVGKECRSRWSPYH